MARISRSAQNPFNQKPSFHLWNWNGSEGGKENEVLFDCRIYVEEMNLFSICVFNKLKT